jgi:processive 1,2-diacylglycerol beta-glucosyltransferase
MGLDNKPCVLFMSSIRGNFPFIRQAIETLKDDFNIIVITGKNSRLLEYFKNKNYPSIRYFPYYEQIWELISLASVVVAKPGGLTVFEGIYKKKPFIFTHYIPGQEKGNMDVLVSQGLARYAVTLEQLLEGIKYFVKEQEKIRRTYSLDVADIKPVLKRLISEGVK